MYIYTTAYPWKVFRQSKSLCFGWEIACVFFVLWWVFVVFFCCFVCTFACLLTPKLSKGVLMQGKLALQHGRRSLDAGEWGLRCVRFFVPKNMKLAIVFLPLVAQLTVCQVTLYTSICIVLTFLLLPVNRYPSQHKNSSRRTPEKVRFIANHAFECSTVINTLT